MLFPYFIFVLFLFSPSESAPSEKHHPFLGLFVFPHGGVALDPFTRNFNEEAGNREGSQEEATRLHGAMKKAAVALMQLRPDIVFLSTPHGLYLEKHYTFVANPRMEGNAGWSWSKFTAGFDVAKEESAKLFIALNAKQNPVELLAFGVGQSTMPLAWGEVIPWWFVEQASKELQIPLPQVIYMGDPPTKNMPELAKLGNDIADYVVQNLGHKRVVFLVSGDLSHYHSNDPRAPYPFNPASVTFDDYIHKWAKIDRTLETEGQSSEILLKKAEGIADQAGSCGYSALVMIHSIMSKLVQENGEMFKSKFYEYAAPTYFGMVVTSWIAQ